MSYLEPEQQSRTLASRADTLAEALCAQCAEKFEVVQPQDYRLFVLVDGRQDGYSKGLDLPELGKVFEDLGCKAAYNLDGGGSAVMIYNHERYSVQSNGGDRDLGDILVIRASYYNTNEPETEPPVTEAPATEAAATEVPAAEADEAAKEATE